jgi:hypothetical protein
VLNIPSYGRWWPAELTVNLMGMVAAVIDYQQTTQSGGNAQGMLRVLGAMQVPPAVVSGIGQSIDGTQPQHILVMSMSSAVFGGLADALDTPGTQKERVFCMVAAYGSRMGLAVETIRTL